MAIDIEEDGTYGTYGYPRTEEHPSWTPKNGKYIGKCSIIIQWAYHLDVYECYYIDASFKNKKKQTVLIQGKPWKHCIIYPPTADIHYPMYSINNSPTPFNIKVKDTKDCVIYTSWIIQDQLNRGDVYPDIVTEILNYFLNNK